MNVNRTILAMMLSLMPWGNLTWAQDLLPTLSYWEMSFQLTRSSELREALHVTAIQKKRIEEMRAEPGWESVFESHANNVREKERNRIEKTENQIRANKRLSDAEKKDQIRKLQFALLNKTMSEKRYVSYTARNETVKERLKEVLTNEQMDALYPTMLRAKYSHGFAPFQDKTFKTYCGISITWPSDRELEYLKQIESRLIASKQKAQIDACRAVVDALPAEPRNRMINLVGKFYSVSFPVTPIDDIPTNEINSTRHILDSPSLQKEMRITSRQLDLLREAEEVYQNEFQELAKSKQLDKNKWIELGERLAETIQDCLDGRQLHQLQLLVHFQALFQDLHYPLKDNRVFKYLDLDPKDLAAFRTVVVEQQTKLRELRSVEDRKAFDEVVRIVPAEAQNKAMQTFKGVWEITTVPQLTWHALSE